MKHTLIIFNSEDNVLVSKTECYGYEALCQFVELADTHGYKCFSTFIHEEYQTKSFHTHGNTVSDDVHTILYNYKDQDQFWSK